MEKQFVSNVITSGAKISFPKIEILWIPVLGQKHNFSMYAIDKYRETYFVKSDEWFKSVGLFKDIDMIEYLKKSESIRIK